MNLFLHTLYVQWVINVVINKDNVQYFNYIVFYINTFKNFAIANWYVYANYVFLFYSFPDELNWIIESASYSIMQDIKICVTKIYYDVPYNDPQCRQCGGKLLSLHVKLGATEPWCSVKG